MKSTEIDTSGQKILYPYLLDHKPTFFLGRFLYWLFKRVLMDEGRIENLKQMHKDGTVVYAIKYRGQLDYLMYHYNFRSRRLPYPKFAFDLNVSMLLPFTQLVKIILSQLSFLFRHGRLPSPYQSGFYKRAIKQGTTSLIILVDPKGFTQHFVQSEKDHLEFLLETQMEMDRPIFIVPQLALYQKSSEKDYSTLGSILFGFKDHPGVIRKIVLFFRYNRQAFIDLGETLNLKQYLETQPSGKPIHEMAAEIRKMLIESIDSQKRVILGPIMKSKQQTKETVLMDPSLTKELESISSGDAAALRRLRKKAGEHFDEIAADFNVSYIQMWHVVLTWLWKKVFEGIDVDTAGLAKVREWARRGPLIYVPSHKSHIDYLVLNDVLYNHHMHVPRVAAGKNLAFWPMGHIFRKSGAFFIRRSFRKEKLYVEVFTRYIKALLEDGHPIQFYIEGGRSRNGKLVLPKTGFLSILLQAHQEGFCKDLIFAPASIAYDRVMEEKSYIEELGGGTKEKESLRQIVKARRFLQRSYGKIYLRFANPFSLNEYLAQSSATGAENRQALAKNLIRAINAVSPVTPLSVIAAAILSNHRKGFLYSEISATVGTMMAFLKRYEVPVAVTLADPEKALQETIAMLVNWKIVDLLEDVEGEEETFYYVDEEKKIELEYYKNSIIHFFIYHAFVAISVLTGTEEVKSQDSIIEDYAFLEDLFKNEFVFDEKKDHREKVMPVIEYFAESGFLSRVGGNGGYKVTKLGSDKLPIWAGLAKTFVESYWIAVKSTTSRKYRGLKKENILRHMNYLGRRFHKSGVVDHVGALSRLNFQNALAYLDKEILRATPSDKGESLAYERLAQIAQKLYELSHYGRQ